VVALKHGHDRWIEWVHVLAANWAVEAKIEILVNLGATKLSLFGFEEPAHAPLWRFDRDLATPSREIIKQQNETSTLTHLEAGFGVIPKVNLDVTNDQRDR
jgi:hypothetical protein